MADILEACIYAIGAFEVVEAGGAILHRCVTSFVHAFASGAFWFGVVCLGVFFGAQSACAGFFADFGFMVPAPAVLALGDGWAVLVGTK